MAEVLSTATVTLNREHREACHELLWEEIFEGASRNDAGRLRLMTLVPHFSRPLSHPTRDV